MSENQSTMICDRAECRSGTIYYLYRIRAISFMVDLCRLRQWTKRFSDIFKNCYSSFKKLKRVWVFIHLWRLRKNDVCYIKTSPKLQSHGSATKSSSKITFYGKYLRYMDVYFIHINWMHRMHRPVRFCYFLMFVFSIFALLLHVGTYAG